MNFKKLFVIMVAMVLALSVMVGCAPEEEPEEVEEEPEEVEEEPDEEPVEDMEIDIVVGFDAGGSHDVTARYVAEALRDEGIQADVVNMPGAMGTEAAYHVAQQDPDENIFMWANPLIMLFEPAAHETGFVLEDFDAVGALASPTFCFGSRMGAPWDTLDELYDYMEENPGEVVLGTQGEGNMMHWMAEMVFPPDEYDYELVPLEGGTDVAMNLAGDHVDVGHMSLAAGAPLHRDGDLEVFVHTQILQETDPLMPDVPNVAEYGMEHAQEPHFLGMFAPAGVDDAVVERIEEAFAALAEDDELHDNFKDNGVVLNHLTAQETWDAFVEVQEDYIPEFKEWLEAQ